MQRVCSVPKCDRPHKGKGLCGGHLQRLNTHGDVLADTPLRTGNNVPYRAGQTCIVEGCVAPVLASWLCSVHYARRRRLGDVRANQPVQRKDMTGRGTEHRGYVVITENGKQVRQHRVVMEQMLGRSLLPGENVHHINGIRNDNRPENLELWVTQQPGGQRVSDLLAWAHEIIDRYES
jgi:hypothetical protein